MLIELINKKAFINELIDYSKIVTKGKPTKSVYDLILDTYNIFKMILLIKYTMLNALRRKLNVCFKTLSIVSVGINIFVCALF